MNIKQVKRGHVGYPDRLERLADPPPFVYLAGQLPRRPMVALVGTRKAEDASLRFAGELAADLVMRGYVVLSGGALGIDTAAHKGALQAGGKTVVVLGSGFDYLYPQKNRKLYEQIEKNGAVLSEYPPHTPPSRWTFPRRNRLVAAMASCVVVVQAPVRSGTLITVRLARELGTPVGVVPHHPGEQNVGGGNQLLRDGVSPVLDCADVEKIAKTDNYCPQLDLPVPVKQVMETPASGEATPPVGLSTEAQRVWREVGREPVHIDTVAARSGLSVSVVAAALMNLEISGFLKDVGGRWFVRS